MTIAVSSPVLHSPPPPRIDDEPLYEIIDGEKVELPPMSILASQVASNLHVELGSFVRRNRLGMSLTETLIRLPLPVDRNRRPDVAFVSSQRIAEGLRKRAPTMPGTSSPS